MLGAVPKGLSHLVEYVRMWMNAELYQVCVVLIRHV